MNRRGERKRTSTVLADLVLVVTKGSVELSELSKLVALVIVLSFGNGSSLCKK